MPIKVEDLSPRDFFSLLQKNVFADDFLVFIQPKRKWMNISVDRFDFNFNPSTMGQYGEICGNLHFDGELIDDIPLGQTVAKICGNNVRCEIIYINCIRSILSSVTIDGGHHEVPEHTNVEIHLLFTYDNRYVSRNWTETNLEPVLEIDRLVESEDMAIKKRKTLFDVIDLD